jgi:hypothetical protein
MQSLPPLGVRSQVRVWQGLLELRMAPQRLVMVGLGPVQAPQREQGPRW